MSVKTYPTLVHNLLSFNMFPIFILAIIFQAIQAGSELLVETASGPVVGEERWGWDSRFNIRVNYTAYPVSEIQPTKSLCCNL